MEYFRSQYITTGNNTKQPCSLNTWNNGVLYDKNVAKKNPQKCKFDCG